jgi:5-methylcytosine-specific restriction endonuclease McrA
MENSSVRSCSICKEAKPEELFGKRTKGIQRRCKACIASYQKEYGKTRPKRPYEKNRHYYDLSDKSARAERSVFYARQSKYGISREDFFLMLEKQNYQCTLCLTPIDKSSHIDHCHTTNKVRGILCARCNKGLGHFKDNIVVLKRAIQYLEEQISERKEELRKSLT